MTFFPPTGASGTPIITQGIALTGVGVARSEVGVIPLDVAGTWRIQVSAVTPQGTVTGINANVGIADEDGNVPDPASPDVPDLPAVDLDEHHRPGHRDHRGAEIRSFAVVGKIRRDV